MPANSFQELYDFPGNIAAAQRAILEADIVALIGDDSTADPDAFIFGPLDTGEDLPRNRISFHAAAFNQASNQQIQSGASGDWFFAHYAGQFSFAVQTPRGNPDATAEHSKRVGRILYLMQPKAARFTSENLPRYEILLLTLSAAPVTTQDNEGTDRTEINFAAEIWIKPGAFPAAIP